MVGRLLVAQRRLNTAHRTKMGGITQSNEDSCGTAETDAIDGSGFGRAVVLGEEIAGKSFEIRGKTARVRKAPNFSASF